MLEIISNAYAKVKKKHNNNQGSSVILVVMTVAFVGMLVAIITYMSYYNYMMKYGDRSAKNSFYTVETALDEINMGLQREMSDSMAECYAEVNKISDKSVTEKETLFKEKIRDNLEAKLRFSTTDTGHYLVNKLTLYLDKTRYNTATRVGAVILTTDADAVMKVEDDMLTLKDVYIEYTDERGYVSMLKTDIVIEYPDITFVSSKDIPDIETYSMIANVRLQTESSTKTQINGNVYGGYEGIYSSNYSQLVFGSGDGTIHRIIAEKLTAENGGSGNTSVITRTGNQLWVGGIDVTSSAISLEDNTYVLDDLTIEGKNSKVTLKGNYFGYGNGYGDASKSSSILINGAKTTLDMSGLGSLMLMGHAYVGATHYNANTADDSDYVEDTSTITANPTDTVPLNSEDLALGQSVAVKSDQLMYMVPIECMGYEGNVQVLAKNPISLSEYNLLTKTYATDATGNVVTDAAGNPVLKYKVVSLDKVCSKLGKSVNSYGASYQPVFRKVNGSILVYYYMVFNSESMANKFFRDYYTADKEALDAYIKEYVTDFKWNNSLGSGTSELHLAGNLIHYDNLGRATLASDTTVADVGDISTLTTTIEGYNDTYTALSKKLLLSKDTLTTEELGRTLFENIVVSSSEFASLVPLGTTMTFNNSSTGESTLIKALLVNNEGGSTFEINDTNSDDLYLVIATGDVRVNVSEFNGLILAGGEISISPICIKMEADEEKVKKALNCKDVVTGNYYAADVLRDRDAYLNYTSSTADDDKVDESGFIAIDKLIHYENWTKK